MALLACEEAKDLGFFVKVRKILSCRANTMFPTEVYLFNCFSITRNKEQNIKGIAVLMHALSKRREKRTSKKCSNKKAKK